MCKFCDTRVKAPADTGGSATTHAAPGQMPVGIGQAGRKTLIRGGHVLSMDAAVGNFTKGDVLIEGSKILAIAAHIDAGDAAVIEQSTREGFLADPALHEALLAGRNRRWAEVIAPLLEGTPRPLIAVGTAHLVGPEGLAALLEAKGYRIRRLSPP